MGTCGIENSDQYESRALYVTQDRSRVVSKSYVYNRAKMSKIDSGSMARYRTMGLDMTPKIHQAILIFHENELQQSD